MIAHITWLDGTVEQKEFVGGQRIQRGRLGDRFFYADAADFVRRDSSTLYFVQSRKPKKTSLAKISADSLRETVRYLDRR